MADETLHNQKKQDAIIIAKLAVKDLMRKARKYKREKELQIKLSNSGSLPNNENKSK